MRIVLVDPSRTMRLFVTRLLEAGGHEVSAFADGTEALACMRADPEVAALITSGEIGFGMSGLELCWETRVLAGRDRPIYVILMSSSIDKSRCARSGRSEPARCVCGNQACARGGGHCQGRKMLARSSGGGA